MTREGDPHLEVTFAVGWPASISVDAQRPAALVGRWKRDDHGATQIELVLKYSVRCGLGHEHWASGADRLPGNGAVDRRPPRFEFWGPLANSPFNHDLFAGLVDEDDGDQIGISQRKHLVQEGTELVVTLV